MRFLHYIIRFYGETAYRLGRISGYYWALRASCNWTHLDWYGRPCGRVFNRVGWIQF